MSDSLHISGASGPVPAPPALITQVERVHAAVAGLAVLVGLVVAQRPVWAGLLAGGLIGGLNFRALGWLAVRLLSGRTRSQHAAIGLLLLKFTALAAAIGAVVIYLRPAPLALLVGVSFAPATLVVVALLRNRFTRPDAALKVHPKGQDVPAAPLSPVPEVSR